MDGTCGCYCCLFGIVNTGCAGDGHHGECWSRTGEAPSRSSGWDRQQPGAVVVGALVEERLTRHVRSGGEGARAPVVPNDDDDDHNNRHHHHSNNNHDDEDDDHNHHEHHHHVLHNVDQRDHDADQHGDDKHDHHSQYPHQHHDNHAPPSLAVAFLCPRHAPEAHCQGHQLRARAPQAPGRSAPRRRLHVEQHLGLLGAAWPLRGPGPPRPGHHQGTGRQCRAALRQRSSTGPRALPR
mmetsp:Transcript_57641/g.134240  ORF Transcript_57641/g.134240 Transcript_57641/m.134240 type:complete len:238 (-) Transcript_57641:1764-2477(-)